MTPTPNSLLTTPPEADPRRTLSPQAWEAHRMQRRFDRLGRLVGDDALARLERARVMILGLGGVGSWTAEALARSGVGALTLVDFDEICITNFNRQLHALDNQMGRPKAEVMAERLRLINPRLRVEVLPTFYNPETSAALLQETPDFVVDAIDAVASKCHLLLTCRQRKIPVVCSTGSGGRLDPMRVEVADLADTDIDPLARTIRKLLRRKYGFPDGPFGIPTVFSKEPPRDPCALAYDNGQGFRCVCPKGHNEFFNCDERHVIMGTAAFVTGAFGLACASVAVRHLISPESQLPL